MRSAYWFYNVFVFLSRQEWHLSPHEKAYPAIVDDKYAPQVDPQESMICQVYAALDVLNKPTVYGIDSANAR